MLICLSINLLLSNAVTLRHDQSMLFSRIVIKSLILGSFLALSNLYLKALGKGIGIYGGLFNINGFTQTFNIFIFILSAVILILTAFYPRNIHIEAREEKILDSPIGNTSIINRILSLGGINTFNLKFLYDRNLILNKSGEQFRIIEYALVIVFILCGAVFLISTADLISIFLSIELQSYGLYILSTLYRNSESATASGLTYFLLGGLSSCFILLGSGLLYANSGTTQLDNIYIISSISEIGSSYSHTFYSGISTGQEYMSIYWYQPYYLHLALIIMLVGFLFKVSAAPFHFWSPDVYDGIPTVVTTYVAIIAKISIFAFLMELVFYTEYSFYTFSWKTILLLSSLFSLIIGSVLGISQFRIKRLYAYSTISHVGFILLALSINSTESIQSYIFYILQYSLSNLNAFLLLVSVGYTLYLYVNKGKEYKENMIDKINSPIQLISQIKGYFYINPFIAISLAITIFSFIGIPPLVGFFAKQMILSAALDNGYIFMSLIAIITSVIGAGYYLNLIREIFFYKNDYENTYWIEKIKPLYMAIPKKSDNSTNILEKGKSIELSIDNIKLNSSLSSVISLITLLLILFIFIPEEWLNIVNILTLILFKT